MVSYLFAANAFVEKGLPANPPVPGKTILISGLETIIETMDTRRRLKIFFFRQVRPLLNDIQRFWGDYGIVFGFSAHSNAFKETLWMKKCYSIAGTKIRYDSPKGSGTEAPQLI